jgi:hypothetical protein
MKEQILALLNAGVSYNEIVDRLGCSKGTIAYHAKNNGLSKGSITHYDWEEVKNFYYDCRNVKKTRDFFGMTKETFYKGMKRIGVKLASRAEHLKNHMVPLDEVMVENSSYSRCCLKRRLLEEHIFENKCSRCGQDANWCGEPLVLVLDHINGINNDNRFENLRLLCPNCNSQTPTFAGRNVRRNIVPTIDEAQITR